MGAMLRLARGIHVADPDMAMRRPEPQPGAKLFVGVAFGHQQWRVGKNLCERPVKRFKQLRPETVSERLQRFQQEAFITFPLSGPPSGRERVGVR